MDSSEVTPGINATAQQYNDLRKDVVLGKKKNGSETDGATITINLADKTKGNIRTIELLGNRTLAVSNPPSSDAQAFVVILKQGGSGSNLVTWWAGIKWVGTSAPTLTTTVNRYDIFSFIYDGTNYYGSIVGLNFG